MDISAHLNADLPEQTVKLDGDATATFKPITPKQFEQINERHTVEKFKRGQPVSKTNFKKVIADVLNLSVISWEGLKDDAGPIEVTPENKVRLYDNYATFRAAFVDIVMGALGDERDFADITEGN